MNRKKAQDLAMVAMVGGSLTAVTAIASWGVYRLNEARSLLNETTNLADTDRDGSVSDSEWSSVYADLGLENTGYQGIDLTSKQLMEYIQNQTIDSPLGRIPINRE